ncbi:MAG: hypothetical protein EPN91_10810 [Salinibacterium sp.]|nr:MAG: hypothetical protein EPN91_10810 [Salinibacterium sp.]
MKITLEPTSRIIGLNGVPARVWEGTTDKGVRLTAFITRVAVDEAEGPAALASFSAELDECPVPTVAWPARLLL